MAKRTESSSLKVLIIAAVVILGIGYCFFLANSLVDVFKPDPTSKPTYNIVSNATSKPASRPTSNPTPTSTPSYASIRLGDSGDNVEKLQMRLIVLGFDVGVPDGSFGAKTENAVKEFQKTAGLTQDGVAGPKTQAALFALTAPTAPPSTKSASTGSNVSSANSGSTQKSETSSSTPEKSSASYIGNRSSKKFHHSWCSSVSDMKASNRVPFDSRSEAIDAEYTPCGRCKP